MAALSEQFDTKPGASEEAIKAMLARLGIEPPGDYLDFLRLTNGAIGLGTGLSYLQRLAADKN